MFEYLTQKQQEEVQTLLGSFMKWVYDHNPTFMKKLSPEELTTCWLEEFETPDWIMPAIENNFAFVPEMNEFIANCFSNSVKVFSIHVEPKFKEVEVQAPPVSPAKPAAYKKTAPPATVKQINFLKSLLKKNNVTLDMSTLNIAEASAQIDSLLKNGKLAS